MAEGGPEVPNREDAGVVGTSPLNASGSSITSDGRNDGLGILGVPAGVWAEVLTRVVKAAVFVSSVGTEDDDEELGVGGIPKESAPSAGAGGGALADGVS